MANPAHQDDIMIGEDKWIEFISLEGRYGQAVPIDSYLTNLWPFIKSLETQCVAACCGFDAFNFTDTAIATALAGLNKASLYQVVEETITSIRSIDSSVLVSSRMNNFADKRVFLQLLEHFRLCIYNAMTRPISPADASSVDSLN